MNLLLNMCMFASQHTQESRLATDSWRGYTGAARGSFIFYLSVYAEVYTQETIPAQNALSTILDSCTTAFQSHVLILCPLGRYTFALL